MKGKFDNPTLQLFRALQKNNSGFDNNSLRNVRIGAELSSIQARNNTSPVVGAVMAKIIEETIMDNTEVLDQTEALAVVEVTGTYFRSSKGCKGQIFPLRIGMRVIINF